MGDLIIGGLWFFFWFPIMAGTAKHRFLGFLTISITLMPYAFGLYAEFDDLWILAMMVPLFMGIGLNNFIELTIGLDASWHASEIYEYIDSPILGSLAMVFAALISFLGGSITGSIIFGEKFDSDWNE